MTETAGNEPSTAGFDGVADSYRASVEQANRLSGRSCDFFAAEKARILGSLDTRNGQLTHILDVGCGIGLLHGLLDRAEWKITGVDPSPRSIAVARAANPDVAYAIGNSTALPFEDDSFDVVSAICVFHHIPPVQRAEAMMELARVAAPYAHLVVIEHHPGHPYTRHSVAHCEFDHDAILLTANETEALMQGAGCASVTTRYVSWTPLGHGLNSLVERLFGRLPLGTQYVTVGSLQM